MKQENTGESKVSRVNRIALQLLSMHDGAKVHIYDTYNVIHIKVENLVAVYRDRVR